MGCWNETCAITNLPICWSDPTVAIPLERNPYNKDACIYPDDMWRPISLPLFGTYDDYGNLENVETHPWNQELLKLGNTKEDSPSNMENTHFDMPVMFVHREIYDKLIEAVGNRVPTGHTKTYRECLRTRLFKQINAKMAHDKWEALRIALLVNKNQNGSEEDRASLIAQINEFENNKEIPFLTENPFRLGHKASAATADYFYKKYAFSDDEQLKQDFIEKILDLMIFQLALNLLRKGYRTVSGSGSQTMETELHIMVAKFTIDMAITMNRRYKEDDFQTYPEDTQGYEEPLYFWD